MARTRRPGQELRKDDLDLSGFGSRTLHVANADPTKTGSAAAAAALEADKLSSLCQLVRRLLETLALWSILCSEDFTGVCADLPDDARRALLQTPLIALATADDGVALAKRCVDKLLARFQGKPGQAPLSDMLHARCPTFHNALDALKTDVCFFLLFLSRLTHPIKINIGHQAQTQLLLMTTKESAAKALTTYEKYFQESACFDELKSVCGDFTDKGVYNAVVVSLPFSASKETSKVVFTYLGLQTLALSCAGSKSLAPALAYYNANEPVEDVDGAALLATRFHLAFYQSHCFKVDFFSIRE